MFRTLSYTTLSEPMKLIFVFLRSLLATFNSKLCYTVVTVSRHWIILHQSEETDMWLFMLVLVSKERATGRNTEANELKA